MYYLNAYIYLDISFQEKVKNYFLFSVIFALFFTFYTKNPKRPNGQSANMAQNVSNVMYFKINQVCKIPPRGGTNVFLARGLNGSIPTVGTGQFFLFCYSRLLRVPHSSSEPMQMKSTMTHI